MLEGKANKLIVREHTQKESGKAADMKDHAVIAAEKKALRERNWCADIENILESKYKASS